MIKFNEPDGMMKQQTEIEGDCSQKYERMATTSISCGGGCGAVDAIPSHFIYCLMCYRYTIFETVHLVWCNKDE